MADARNDFGNIHLELLKKLDYTLPEATEKDTIPGQKRANTDEGTSQKKAKTELSENVKKAALEYVKGPTEIHFILREKKFVFIPKLTVIKDNCDFQYFYENHDISKDMYFITKDLTRHFYGIDFSTKNNQVWFTASSYFRFRKYYVNKEGPFKIIEYYKKVTSTPSPPKPAEINLKQLFQQFKPTPPIKLNSEKNDTNKENKR